MGRVAVYIDGYNLYHGIHATHGRSYLWLDPVALAKSLIRRDQQLVSVTYFTARLRQERASRLRQLAYLEALAAHCVDLRIVEGRFQERTRTCRACRATWTTHEEKETDVNLAVSIVEDAARDRYDVALVVSADSDLCPAIHAARRMRPGMRTVVVFPPSRYSDKLKRVADAVYWLGRDKLSRAQLPVKVTTAAGIVLTRPAHWT